MWPPPDFLEAQTVETVLGPIPANQLGVTLPHEHFYCVSTAANFSPLTTPDADDLANSSITLEMRGWLEYNWQSNRDNLRLDDEATAIAEAIRYRSSGGATVIDVTPIGIGRNPLGLAKIARAADINVVMGSSFYVASTHPASVEAMSRDQIAELIIDEFANGVEDTAIKPGVIGEVGCSWPLIADERKVLQASALAQQELAAALYVHPGRNPDAPFEIIGILSDAGADLTRVVMCHIERTIQDFESLRALLSHGCYIEYDLFGLETTGSYYTKLGITMPSDSQRISQIRHLNDSDYGNKILISHDICFKHRLAKYGGSGYDHILNNVVPLMYANGYVAADIERLMVTNPRRVIAGV